MGSLYRYLKVINSNSIFKNPDVNRDFFLLLPNEK